MRDDNRTARERQSGDADGRGHGLVEVDDVELLVVEDATNASDRPRRENNVRERAVRGHDNRTADGDDSFRQGTMPTGPRVEETREPTRGIVAHHDLHIVPAEPESSRLVLAVLDHASPV